MKFDEVVAQASQKWKEVPGATDTQPRQFSDELLKHPNEELLAWWDKRNAESASLRGWYRRLYGPILKGKKVVEIGSGLGFDAVHFSSEGARITCCDIAPSNLEVIQRIASLKGLNIETLSIESLHSFERLPVDFDFVWAIGSIHHIPFDGARQESLEIIKHLKLGGRWIELSYPRERWVREGSPKFSDWGRMTDGDRTPWVEWYDSEKLKTRLSPWRLEFNLEYRHESNAYIWLDCQVIGQHSSSKGPIIEIAAPNKRLAASGKLWDYAWSAPLPMTSAAGPIAIEIEAEVQQGSVGFVAWKEEGDEFLSREVIVDTSTGNQLIYLKVEEPQPNLRLLTRNASARGTSFYQINSIRVRPQR